MEMFGSVEAGSGQTGRQARSDTVTAGKPTSRPVFVVGSPRSGTTAVAWALGQHSRLWTSGEAYLAWHLLGTEPARLCLRSLFEEAAVLGEGSMVTSEQVTTTDLRRAIGSAIHEVFVRHSGGLRWVDHTPVQTLMIDVLAEAFPHAQFVHVLRDGRRVVESMLAFRKAIPTDTSERMRSAGWDPDWMRDVGAAARTWSVYVNHALDFANLHPERVHTVRHEHLRQHPDRSIGSVLEFLSEAPEEGPTDYLQSEAVHPSFAPGADRAGIWTKNAVRTFDREAGATMNRVGY